MRVASCNGRRGSGHWPTRGRMGPCLAAKRLLVPTIGRSGGADSSRTLAWLAPLEPKTHKHYTTSRMKGGRAQVLRPESDQSSRGAQQRSRSSETIPRIVGSVIHLTSSHVK